jgi:integrase
MHSNNDALAAVTFRTPAYATVDPTLAELIDAYMLAYTGRDRARPYRLATRTECLGARRALEITDDDVYFTLECLGSEPALIYMGRDAKGNPIHRSKGSRKTPGTVNRFRDALSGVYNWAIRTRRLPKGTQNPCHAVAKHPEHPGVVRFLEDDERTRLLAACKVAGWARLYALVLMAITTGARRSELLGLRWRYVDLERRQARITLTKNSEAKVPLAFTSSRSGRPRSRALACAVSDYHDLCHTCASYLAQNGATLLEIADVLGHKQMQMVKRYSHLTVGSKAALIDKAIVLLCALLLARIMG